MAGDSTEKTVYLALGSNMGDRAAFLKEAAVRLEKNGLKILRASHVYETEPQPRLKQSWFLNQVLSARTNLPPTELIELCQGIEEGMGRKRNSHWQSRPIDIDILLYGQDIVDLPDLKIPHARMNDRPFALIPLLDVEPDLADPVTGKKYRDILEGVQDNHKVIVFSKTS